ncbi:MAG TPA: DUF3383 family protein, partial [Candidatus Paceibacterota bacterium]|nr:DUF3383 family protein [Candidatus Paceibacterota bacterium]
MQIDYFVDVQITLRTASVSLPAFDAELFLVDSDWVPIDKRILVVTKDDVEDLPTSSVERLFATDFFAQDLKADRLILGRVALTAVPPAFVCGTHVTTVATWEAVDAGSFTVTDSDSHSVVVSAVDFTGVTTFAQVLETLNDALDALVAPTIVGLDTATFALDALDRVVLTMPSGQDDTDPTIEVSFNASAGTIPYLLGLRVTGAGTSVPGNAIETWAEAYTAVKEFTEAFYNVAIEERLTTDPYTDVIALAAQIELERRQATFVDCNPDAVDGASASDLQSELALLGYDQSLVLYTEHYSRYPDAAADGAFLPAEPCTRSYGHTPLVGCYPSGGLGDDYDLSSTDRLALEDKGGNYIARAGGYTFVHRGKTAGGVEKRMMLGKHWLESNIQAEV